MHGLGPTVVFVILILPQPHLIRMKFDRDFQRFRHKPRITALFVRDQTFNDFRIGAQSVSGPIASEYPLRTGRHRGGIKSTTH